MAVIDEQMARAESLLDGDSRAGLGVALAHCADSIECSLAGYPKLKPRLFRATIGALVKRRFLRAGKMRHDVAAGLPGQPRLDGDAPADAAIARLKRAVATFREHRGPLAPHPVYGACTHDEYERLHAMHLADHLSAFG